MAGRALDQADAAVAQAQQMVGDRPGGRFVLDLDAGAVGPGGGRRDADIGYLGRVQGVQHDRIVADRRQQDDAVDLQAIDQGLHVRGQVEGGKIDGLHHQMAAGGAAGPERPQLGVHGVGADLVQQKAHLIRARAGQAPRRDLGPVAQLAGDAQDPVADLLAHVRLRVQHARDRLHRHARPARHIGDGD